MELVNQATPEELNEGMCRIEAAAVLLEKTVAWLAERQASLAGDVERIVATVESGVEIHSREQELEKKLLAAEEEIATLKAQSEQKDIKAASIRQTVSATSMLSKHGLDELDHLDASSLDAALVGLSLEQRIAVKSQLLRAGTLSK